MTVGHPSSVRTLTADDVQRELARLIADVETRGYTLDDFKAAGDRWELDADERGLLADIRSLEYFRAHIPQ